MFERSFSMSKDLTQFVTVTQVKCTLHFNLHHCYFKSQVVERNVMSLFGLLSAVGDGTIDSPPGLS
jgi:hypothetical protein